MAELDQCIVEKCNESWEEEFTPGHINKNNCSGFVNSVASKLGIPLPSTANADGIASHVAANWIPVASGAEAARLASTGQFVLAVLKSNEHTPARNNGHVAIVVSGPLYRERYPMLWGGSIGGAQSRGTKSVGEVWSRMDRDRVKYFTYGTAACR